MRNSSSAPVTPAAAVDSSANLFVGTGSSIQKFNSSGQYVLQWGTAGTGLGQFFDLGYLCTDAQGYVYASDNPLVGTVFNGRIQKFDTNGNFVCYVQITGDEMEGINVDPTGNLYAVDGKNETILKF